MTVLAGSIVEDLDVVEDVRTGQLTSFVDTFADALQLQVAEDGFCDRVIPVHDHGLRQFAPPPTRDKAKLSSSPTFLPR
jgi:hypothetical protein